MSPFPPLDETPAMLAVDRANFVALLVEGVLWGADAVIFFLCLYHLCQTKAWKTRRTYTACITTFVFVMFVLGTYHFVCDTALNIALFVDNRFPGGPSGEAAVIYFDSSHIIIAGEATFFIGSFLTDGLLLYRTWMVWGNNLLIIALPVVLWLASFIMSMLQLAQQITPNAALAASFLAIQLTFLSCTAALNIILTLLITCRLIAMSRRTKETFGAEHAKAYTSIAAMVVESALPYSATLLAFLVATAVDSASATSVLGGIMAQMMCISPMLIIWRVAAGRAWSRQTVETINGRRFSSGREVNVSMLEFRRSQDIASSPGRSNPHLAKEVA